MPLTERSRHKLYETFTALIDDEDANAIRHGHPTMLRTLSRSSAPLTGLLT